METGSLRVAPGGKRIVIDIIGLEQACHAPLAEHDLSLSFLEHLLQGHVDLCYSAWRWLLQSHFIYGGFIGRGVGVQYNFSHSDVSISLTSHLHS